MLHADLQLRRGTFHLDARVQAEAGRIVVLAGENASGKTTLLRALAGLERLDKGHVRLAGEDLVNTSTGLWRAPEQRPIGYVAQSYALFPHLSVRDNIGYGLRALPSAEREARIEHFAGRFGVRERLDDAIGALSGGQRQRVALARALVREPRLLLLDEPLAALDPLTRAEVRHELRRVLAGLECAMVIVTHDPVDALALADDLVVLERGRVSQVGPLSEVLRAPASAWVARFLGVNLFVGPVTGPAGPGTVWVQVEDARFEVPTTPYAAIRVVLQPREITLARDLHRDSARNHLEGVVREVAPEPPHGDTVRVTLEGRPALIVQVTRASAEALELGPGTRVFATFKATACTVSPA